MTEQQRERTKQSFIVGSLTSSAGVFLSKAIGLFYMVPFTALATEENMAFYSAPYSYYSILLQICSAGIPFAAAAVIAKYASRNDWKTVMLARKISKGILCVSGFVFAVMFALLSGVLSRSTLGPLAEPQDILIMQKSFMILSLALFLVPLLSSYRSFYQGLKDLRVYADSQVIEQLGRVISLLGLGFIAVRILHMASIYAVYMAVLATSIGAMIAIFFYDRYDRRNIGHYRRLARAQERSTVESTELLKEILIFGLPFLIGSIVGNSQQLVNTRYFVNVATELGMPYADAKLLYGIIQLQCDKLTSIPQVLGMGFSAGIVPYMTIALETKNYTQLRRNVRECLETTLFIGMPVCFIMLVLARPVYYVMYGGANLDYGEICLQVAAVLALVTTITPICSSMMMTLKLRKESIIYLCCGFLIKAATFYPMMKYTGYTGAITSSIFCSLSIIYLDLAKLSSKFGVSYRQTGVYFLRILTACLAMNGGFAILRILGFTITEASRIKALIQLGVYGIVGMVIYLAAANMLKIPQGIFRKSLKEIADPYISRLRRRS